MIRLKRVYDPIEKEDGFRVLVDRLWPRGLSKEKAQVDIWLKDIAPSDSLRKWFHHEDAKWGEFEKKYREELENKQELIGQLKTFEKEKGTLTLLYGARDTEHNQAVVLVNLLK